MALAAGGSGSNDQFYDSGEEVVEENKGFLHF